MNTDFLNTIGHIWTQKDFPADIVESEGHDKAANVLLKMLTSKPPRSVLVSGESGVGKTTLIHLVSRALKKKGWFVFQSGAQDIMAGQRYIGDLEKQVKDLVYQLTSRQKTLFSDCAV